MLNNSIIFLLFISFVFKVQARSFEEIDQIIAKYNGSTKILNHLKNSELENWNKNHDLQSHLKIKYINFYKAANPQDKLKIILYLQNKSSNKDTYLRMMCNYHLAHILGSVSLLESQKLMRVVKKDAALLNNQKIENETNVFFASYYFWYKKDYKNAIYYWGKARQYYLQKKNILYATSMLNNIAIAESKLGDKNACIKQTIKAIDFLKNEKSKESKLFRMQLQSNLGKYYCELGKYAQAKGLIEPYYEFCFTDENLYQDIPGIVSRLILINTKTNQKNLNVLLINDSKRMLRIAKTNQLRFDFCHQLFEYYVSLNDQENIAKYAKLLIALQKKINNQTIEENKLINEELTKNTILTTKTSFENELKYEHQKALAGYAFIGMAIIIGSLFFFFNRKNQQKQALIEAKNEQIENIEQDLVAIQHKQQQEKLLALQMNVHIKNATAQAFADKLKQLKRKKEINSEEVIKELQVQISNLLNIDKKNAIHIEDSESEKKKFNDTLRSLHPQLTNQDLQLCAYYNLNLSAKEIATLEGITPGSAHVYKNKLKNKLGLKPEDNLNEYLKGII